MPISWSIDPPITPGIYWFRHEHSSEEIMVDVGLTDGVSTVWWPIINHPVAKLRGSWSGPIPPSCVRGFRDPSIRPYRRFSFQCFVTMPYAGDSHDDTTAPDHPPGAE